MYNMFIASCDAKNKEENMKTIKSITVQPDSVIIECDGDPIVLRQKQQCCEERHFACDDDLSAFVGAKFLGYDIAMASSKHIPFDGSEMAFLNLRTSVGVCTIQAYNDHNGYYGGFCVLELCTDEQGVMCCYGQGVMCCYDVPTDSRDFEP